MNSELNLDKKGDVLIVNSSVLMIKQPTRLIGILSIVLWLTSFISNRAIILEEIVLLAILCLLLLSSKLQFLILLLLMRFLTIFVNSPLTVETTFKTDRIVIINTKTGEKKVYYQSEILSLEFHEERANLIMTLTTQSRIRTVFLGHYTSSLDRQYQLAEEIREYCSIYYPDVIVIIDNKGEVYR